MGANLSTTTTTTTTSPQNPSDLNPSQSTSKMSSISPRSQNPDPKTPENQDADPKTLEEQNPEISNQPTNPDEKGQNQNQTPEEKPKNEGEEEEAEEEGECGFCLFMKGGGCKDEFIAWEICVEEGEKNKEDIVEKCFEVTGNLKKCMEAHSEYYEPILRAEKAADDEVNQELEHHANEKNGKTDSGTKSAEETVEIEVEKQG